MTQARSVSAKKRRRWKKWRVLPLLAKYDLMEQGERKVFLDKLEITYAHIHYWKKRYAKDYAEYVLTL